MWYNHVVGQHKILDSVLDNIKNDQLSHALILEGYSGYGGLPISLAIAERLLCTHPQEDRSCGTCKACQQVQKLIHPDLHIAFPVVRKEGKERKSTTAKDFMTEWRQQVFENPYLTYNEWIRAIAKTTANGDINVTECTEIIQHLNMRSFIGGKKIQIIWIADRLGANGNKLLKIIEEPPPNTHIILVCDTLESLLMTIVSRCSIIRVPRIDDDSIATALSTHLDLDEDMAKNVAYISDGNFSAALEYTHLDQNNLMELCMQWFSICNQGDILTMRKWAMDFSRYNLEEQKALLQYFQKLLQALIYYKLMGSEYVKFSERDKKLFLKHAFLNSLGLDSITYLKDLGNEMMTLLERYVNGRMVMFDACLKISKVLHAQKSKRSETSTS